ncbi:bacteriohemerythrin [Sulfurimonas lithotrophica]|uniref:Bacteriohemerythrin n=1 Tax=Sulfurimonas lithotrophica TaxID=2590022 RepID=A0A5P8P395_9BACT|nr:bacteriohemerythrin [Sulfurimonas lithotrophica]QFR50067.1 bacteriohemerythrin [Sulfurimonas lithotrophica]
MSSEIQNIKWSKEYETGVEEIDEQHHILVNTLNEANHILSNDYSLTNLQTITKDLLSYALYHFEEEEELMHEYHYREEFAEDYQEHMKQHRYFSTKVVEIRDSLKAGNLIGKDELISFLLNWLLNHIDKTDKKLGKFLQTKM